MRDRELPQEVQQQDSAVFLSKAHSMSDETRTFHKRRVSWLFATLIAVGISLVSLLIPGLKIIVLLLILIPFCTIVGALKLSLGIPSHGIANTAFNVIAYGLGYPAVFALVFSPLLYASTPGRVSWGVVAFFVVTLLFLAILAFLICPGSLFGG
jgi:hypothetical protein